MLQEVNIQSFNNIVGIQYNKDRSMVNMHGTKAKKSISSLSIHVIFN